MRVYKQRRNRRKDWVLQAYIWCVEVDTLQTSLYHEKLAVSSCIILCISFSSTLTIPFNFFPI